MPPAALTYFFSKKVLTYGKKVISLKYTKKVYNKNVTVG